MSDRGVIEAMLLGWIDNQTGRKVTFLLPDDEGDHPFKGLKCGPAHGQRVALSVALIADDESQTEPADTGGAAECGRDNAVHDTEADRLRAAHDTEADRLRAAHDARTARQSGDSDAPEPRGNADDTSEPESTISAAEAYGILRQPPDPATECAAAQPEADAIAEEARGGTNTGDATGSRQEPTIDEHQRADPYHYQRQAGMRCREKLFCDFLSEQHCDGEWDMSRPESVVAAGVVHDICLVKSRKEFDTDPDAAKRWRGLLAEFDEWRGLV